MSKEKLLAARQLIQEKHYDEARAILKTIDHPAAQEWLAKLDKIAPEKKAKKRRSPLWMGGMAFACLFIVYLASRGQQNSDLRSTSPAPTATTAEQSAMEATPGPSATITDTPLPTNTEPLSETPLPSATPTLIPTVAPLIYNSNNEGLMPVIGPVTFPSGIYRATVRTDGFFIGKIEPLTGNCESGIFGLFNLSSGDANAGASSVFKSQDCVGLITISNVTSPWTLTFEAIPLQTETYAEIPSQFSRSNHGLMPVLGPFTLSTGTFRVTVTTPGFFIAHFETLDGDCDTGIFGLFNLSSGQANTGASSVLRSQDCNALISISNVTDAWTLTFEKIT